MRAEARRWHMYAVIGAFFWSSACAQGVILDYDLEQDQSVGVDGANKGMRDAIVVDMGGLSPNASGADAEGMMDMQDQDMSMDLPDIHSMAYHPAMYPTERTHSPMTLYVIDRLEEIRSINTNQKDDVFAKIGASNTVNTNFLGCFDDSVLLDGREHLAGTIAHFAAGDADGASPYDRVSLSAKVGWSVHSALAGDPSPVDQELRAISPSFATILYGSNDIQRGDIFTFGEKMLDLIDLLMARGVVPIVTSVSMRDDDAAANLLVPRYNAVLRGLAQGRQVPLIDLHRELLPLPEHGIGSDGLHLNVKSGGAKGCDFTAAGLEKGHNTRNLITMEAFHRLKQVLLDGGEAPDPAGPKLVGKGTAHDPFLIPSVPFTDMRDTTMGAQDVFDAYDGCSAKQNESGQEFVYQFTLAVRTDVRLLVLDRGSVDVDLHLLGATPTTASCMERNHQAITATLDAGTYHVVLDTFVSSTGVEHAGEYLFVLLTE